MELYAEPIFPTPSYQEIYGGIAQTGQTLFQPTILGGSTQVGAGNESGHFSAEGLFLGATTFAAAPFSVTLGGQIKGTSGLIGGWSISSTQIVGGNLVLASSGYISAGTGNDVVVIDSMDAVYRLWVGNVVPASAPFSVTKTGAIFSVLGQIAGWYLAATTFSSNATEALAGISLNSSSSIIRVGSTAGNYLLIDGPNQRVSSSNYVSGVMGSGFLVSPDLLEVGNARIRGSLMNVSFQKDIVSSIGGKLLVTNSDTLASDMTALDSSTLTILGTTTFSVNDILWISNGVSTEYLRVTNIASAPTYTVTRDLAGAFGANANPVWTKGTSVQVIGSSDGVSTYSGGWLYMVGAGTNAPYYSIVRRTGIAYNAFSEYARYGNLNGFLDYVADTYGVALGDANNFIAIDPVNGFRINTSAVDAITINQGGNIQLKYGGSIKFSSISAPTALTATLIATGTGNVTNGFHTYKVTFVNAYGETELGAISNPVTVDASHKQVALSNIPTSTVGSVTARNIYRLKVLDGQFHLLTTISDNVTTVFTDNISDASLGADVADNRENTSFGDIIVDSISVFSAGSTNTRVGQNALSSVSFGAGIVAVGVDALKNSTDAYWNTAIGNSAMKANVGGSYNVGIGYHALFADVTGEQNVAIGSEALSIQNGINRQVAIGYQAGYKITAGSNTMVGNAVMGGTTGGASSSNVAIGDTALFSAETAIRNVVLGMEAGFQVTTGDNNVLLGFDAGYSLVSGSGNVFIGYQAAYSETGSNKLYISNSNTATPLLYGEFDNQILRVNGEFQVTGRFDGWILSSETWTYASADDPTFTFTISGDKTGKYSPGMRLRVSQSTGGTKYFIITKVVYGAPNTTVTVYGGTNYNLENETISSPAYSPEKSPFGFPLDPLLWTVEINNTSLNSQATPSAATWYNIGSINISIPIGSWHVSYQAFVAISKASNAVNMGTTLSQANNSDTDFDFKTWNVSNFDSTVAFVGQVATTVYRSKTLLLAAKTTYYLNEETTVSSAGTMYVDGTLSPVIIRAVCAYL